MTAYLGSPWMLAHNLFIKYIGRWVYSMKVGVKIISKENYTPIVIILSLSFYVYGYLKEVSHHWECDGG